MMQTNDVLKLIGIAEMVQDKAHEELPDVDNLYVSFSNNYLAIGANGTILVKDYKGFWKVNKDDGIEAE